MTAGTELTEELPAAAAPGDQQTRVDALESRMDRVDVEILALVRERVALFQALTAARVEAGGSRFLHERQLAAARRFRQLGPLGADLAAVVLRLCSRP